MKKSSRSDQTPPHRVFVVGSNTLQNELIASTLQDQTGFPCFVVQDLAHIEPYLEGAGSGACLALYDCLGKDGDACLADLKRNGSGKDFATALFNLERDKGLERSAFSYGSNGFFYQGDPFSLLLRGVVKILEGDIWISRRLLSEWIPREMRPLPGPGRQRLSTREKEILSLLSGGAGNEEIAAALFISPHTVKNHLQRIFRKIGVHTKTEAALWASRYLPGGTS